MIVTIIDSNNKLVFREINITDNTLIFNKLIERGENICHVLSICDYNNISILILPDKTIYEFSNLIQLTEFLNINFNPDYIENKSYFVNLFIKFNFEESLNQLFAFFQEKISSELYIGLSWNKIFNKRKSLDNLSYFEYFFNFNFETEFINLFENKVENYFKKISNPKNFKKGTKIKIIMDNEIEIVEVMSEFKAGISRLNFISLKRKIGAPYTITIDRLYDIIQL